MKKIFLLIISIVFNIEIFAQKTEDQVRALGLPAFPKITNTNIPGAPLLGQPLLITGTEQDIRTEKHGLAYPAFYDWDKDGKVDLLLGEFETGETGSNIKVYLNNGTNKKPKYTGKYFYALDTKGDTITAHQWCCIGIHPRLKDLNKDGYADILTGQYNPGLISWWRGTKEGFLPRIFVEQERYKEGARLGIDEKTDELDPRSNNYWNYTSASFGDFNDDGLDDLFVGGFGEFRVALNEGTKETPKFGLRKYLLGIDGLPLSVVKPNAEQIEQAGKAYRKLHYAGVYKSFVTPFDWDGDGVLDLLVTHLYGNNKTKDPVVFFRGVKTDKGLRFEDAKPLFTAEESYKTFPGCQPNITITDYNCDGVLDIVFGISLPSVNGFQIDSLIAWGYLNDYGIQAPGKDAGRAIEWEGTLENLIKKIENDKGMKSYYLGRLNDYKYLTIRHRGYVYVMLGKKNQVKAVAKNGIIAKEEIKPPLNETKQSGGEGPVSFNIKAPALVGSYQSDKIEVILNFKEGWYGYADTKTNTSQGWIPTKVEFSFPKGFEPSGEIVLPSPEYKGAAEIYKGEGLKFEQAFTVRRDPFNSDNKLPAGEYIIKATIHYQTCNGEQCLPSVTESFDIKIKYANY